MSKKVIQFPPGRLMEVAKQHGVKSKSELHDLTGADRKTISTADKGRPVRQSTIKRIADGLKIPLSDIEGTEDDSVPWYPTRTLDLRPITGKLLKEFLDRLNRPERVKWSVNLLKFDDALHSALLTFKKGIDTYIEIDHGLGEWAEKYQSLEAQLSKIRIGEELDGVIQKITALGVRLFGESWVRWEEEGYEYMHPDGSNRYESVRVLQTHFIISVEPKSKTSSRATVPLGLPPKKEKNEDPKDKNEDSDIPF